MKGEGPAVWAPCEKGDAVCAVRPNGDGVVVPVVAKGEAPVALAPAAKGDTDGAVVEAKGEAVVDG